MSLELGMAHSTHPFTADGRLDSKEYTQIEADLTQEERYTSMLDPENIAAYEQVFETESP